MTTLTLLPSTHRPARPPAGLRPAHPTSAARQWSAGTVRVFDHDPELLDSLDEESAAVARALAVTPSLVVDRGRWSPPAAERCQRILGLLVLDGLLTRSIEVDGISSPELIGQGDVLRPWPDPEPVAVGYSVSWTALQPTTFAVLDARFVEVLRRWPWIVSSLLARTVDRSRCMALQMTIPQLRRADARLRLLFQYLADRWGRVTPAGIVVELPLTNQLISELVCLRRPTVSTTMSRMADSGEIVRQPGGRFLLNLRDDDRLDPAGDAPHSAA